jgi:O-antigen/teichoic acid export membrane protein
MKFQTHLQNILINPKSFFLKNLGVKQTIFKNTFWLAAADGITRFLKLILIIYVARILGATDYGRFNFALAFVGLFAFFSDLGISSITTRELSQDKEKEKEFSSIISLKLLLVIGTLILILIGSFFITPDYLNRKLIWILGLFSVVEGFSVIIFAFIQARQKMEYQAWTRILEALVVTAAGFFVILNFPSVVNLSYSYLFASLVALIFILIFFHFRISPLKISFQKSIWKRILSLSWPLAIAGVFGVIYTNTDSVMMGYFGQITQTGWYNAAQKITNAVMIIPGLISVSFFPVLSKFLIESKEKLQKTWNYYFELMIFFAAPIVAGGILFAPRIIDFVYDPSYLPSILAFQMLIIMTGIGFLCSPFSQALIVAHQQKKLFWITLLGAIINVILNSILIPKYSLYGAAAATVVTIFLILILLFRFTLKLTPIKPFNLKFLFSFLSAIFATIPMYFIISQPRIYNLNVFLSILIGAAVYTLIYLILRTLIKYSRLSLCK